MLHRLTFFSSIKYCIGGIEYSANDIEHGILRGNRPSPASPAVLIGRPQWAGGYFKQNDPRMQQVRCSLVRVCAACCMLFWLRAVMHQAMCPFLHGHCCIWGRQASSKCALSALATCTLQDHAHFVRGHVLQRVSPAAADRTGLTQNPCKAGGLCRKAGGQHDQVTTLAIAQVLLSAVACILVAPSLLCALQVALLTRTCAPCRS